MDDGSRFIQTSQKCKIDFVMPELSSTQKCMWEVHLKPEKVSPRYDIIIGRDLLHTLGIQLNFKKMSYKWQMQKFL